MSAHYHNILKRVTNRMWDTLSDRDREIIASDVKRESELAKWFNKTVLAEAKAKFESPTYWMNEQFSFYHDPRNDLFGNRVIVEVVAPTPTPAKVSKRAKNKARRVERELVAA